MTSQIAWLSVLPIWAWFLFGIVAVAAIAAPLWSAPRVPHAQRWFLVAMRATALVVLALALAGLSEVTVRSHAEHRPLVVIVDGSASMGVRSEGRTRLDVASRHLMHAAAAVEAGDVELCWAGDGVSRVEAVAELPGPEGLRSDYLAAVTGCLDLFRPSAALLVGDGADRADIASALDREGEAGVDSALASIPFAIHTLAVGDPIRGDVSVRIGDLAPFAFVRRPVDVPVQLTSQAGVEGEISVSLREEGALVSSQTVTLAPDGGDQALSFRVLPQRVGYLTVEVEVPVPAEDPLPGNNTDGRTLRVIRDRTRVLQLAGHPSWDVRFLRRVLATDPNVDLVSFYIMRTGPLPGRFRFSPLSLIEFPHEELFGEDLSGFDLVVLQNFTFGTLPSALSRAEGYRDNLARFVEDGGALALVGGEIALLHWDHRDTPLGNVLPFATAEHEGVAHGSWSIELSEAGRRHPVTELVGDAQDNLERWRSLPPIRTRNEVGATAPGGVVLARAGGETLLAVREVGDGRVLALTSDDSWRWAMTGAASSGRSHADFWRDAVRWLVRDERDHRVEILPARETLHLGEAIQLEVWLRHDDYAPRAGSPFELHLRPMGVDAGERRSLLTDAEGFWSGELAPDTAGTWVFDVEAGVLQSSARVTVRPDPPELDDPTPRHDLLAAMSRTTGGEVLAGLDGIETLAAQSQTRWVTTSTVPVPLWDRAWLLTLAAALLSLQWWLGRRWGAR